MNSYCMPVLASTDIALYGRSTYMYIYTLYCNNVIEYMYMYVVLVAVDIPQL